MNFRRPWALKLFFLLLLCVLAVSPVFSADNTTSIDNSGVSAAAVGRPIRTVSGPVNAALSLSRFSTSRSSA